MEEVSTSRRSLAPVATGIVGLGVGLVCGYLFGKRQGSITVVPAEGPKQLDLFENYEPHDEETKALYTKLVAPYELNQLLDREEEMIRTNSPEGRAQVVVNIFENRTPAGEWNYELELQGRSSELPYIISAEEFYNREMGYRQTSLTYYAGDDILTDEADVPIPIYGKVVGELRFGHGSDDKDIVFVRNEKLETEYEILRSSDHYQVVVLGAEIEAVYQQGDLKHSTRRFRDWD